MQRSLPNPSIDYLASAPAPPLPCQQRASVVTRYVAACHMGATVLHETAFRKAEDVVKGWGVDGVAMGTTAFTLVRFLAQHMEPYFSSSFLLSPR